MYTPPQQPPYQSLGPMNLEPENDNDKIMGALAYIIAPIMSVIILMTDMKNKPFLKYHAYQALTFGIGMIIIWAVVIPILSFALVGLCLIPFALLIPFIFAYQAYSKGIFTIPVITDLTASMFKEFPGGKNAGGSL